MPYFFKLTTKFLTLLILFTLSFSSLTDVYAQSKVDKYKNTTDSINNSKNKLKNKAVLNRRLNKITYSAWVPSWASETGYNSLVRTENMFYDLSPVWYKLKNDGSIENVKPKNASEFIRKAKSNKVKLIPTVATFDYLVVTDVLQNNENFDRHINSIIKEVEANNYDGIDLDYESTQLSDKAKYFEMLKKLSEELHKRDKVLSVTVISKWGDNIVYGYLPQTRKVQDWSEIAKYADEVRIMAYDYVSQSGKNPGPIGPISWHKRILDYALTEMPKEKIVLGVHLYSYEWAREKDESNPGQFSEYQSPARSYSFGGVQNIKNKYPGETAKREGEVFYKYNRKNDTTGKEEERMLVYIDREGVEARENLALEYGIKGVAFWRLGDEKGLLMK